MKTLRINVRNLIEQWFDEIKPATFPNVAVNCPFCIDGRYRFYVLTEEDDEGHAAGTGYCHNDGCGSHSFLDLYTLKENCSRSEAFEQLYSENPEPRYGKLSEALEEYVLSESVEKQKVDGPVVWPTHYHALWGLTAEQWELATPTYMKERKITQEMCEVYGLGYCTGGYWVNRMIIPIYQGGKLVAYQGRAMYACKEKKYLFNMGANIGSYLYNLDLVPPEFNSAILVEGVFDVWGVVRAGFPNAIASFGKHLTRTGRSKLISRFQKVYLLWDDDAVLEIVTLAEELDGMIEVHICSLKGKDPDEATTDSVKTAILEARPYSREFKMQALLASMSLKSNRL
jgi:5S rRNA maturation endonuclease (ribonuclease M5)